ncbi:MAG: kynureninase [Caldilineaceae bacterium]|nr:kynureninase [Caldilineaceae bacterium]
MTDITSAAYAAQLDAQDPLRSFRGRFVHDDSDLIYLDGNSLGRLPTATLAQVDAVLHQQWGNRLIRSWNEGWMALPTRIGDKIGRLVGAAPGEVAIADSTSVNLFKLALAALTARPDRHKIVTDDLNFPSDVYILQAAADLAGRPCRVEIVPSPDGIHGPVEALTAAIDVDTALVSLSHTVFKSAYTYDMAEITRTAHAAGALTLWDLSHAAGAVSVALNAAQADLAVGCCYKYLNGGPGAPAFLYVRADLQEKLRNPISGWMGQKNMFNFDLTYTPAPGLPRFFSGTPPVLAMAAIEPGVDLLLEAGMDRLRAKSVQQTEYLIALWESELAALGFTLNSPRAAAVRGSHISLGHADAWRIDQALIQQMGVLPDFRKPDNIRLGITPLYTSFADIQQAVSRMRTVVEERIYAQYNAAELAVT